MTIKPGPLPLPWPARTWFLATMAPHTIAGSHPRRDVPPRRDRPRPTWRSIPLRGGRPGCAVGCPAC